MLYTDGLVERRDASIDDGIARVADVVADGLSLTVDAVADAALAAMEPTGGYDDDVAIVVYRHPYASLVIESEAIADELADIRHRLMAWMRDSAVSEDLVADVVLAVNEACANSIEHGYRGQQADKVRVDAGSDGAELQIRITDSGSWKPAASDPGNRGRGLLLIRSVSDWLELDCTPSGTTVEMTFRLLAERRVHAASDTSEGVDQ